MQIWAALFTVFGSLAALAACTSQPASSVGGGPLPASAAATPVPAAVSEVPVAPVAKVEPDESPMEKLLKVQNYGDAVSMVKPLMDDAFNEISAGTAMMGIWAAQHMRWSDIGVDRDETTFARIMKDSEEEKAKRMCATGMVIEIAVERTPVGKLATGLLLTNGGNLYHFAAAGSSGDIVGRSRARICGVVIGKYDYSNSGGGTGHAVQLVGMFDIAENRSRY